ncbi:MAG: hypothetical protein R3360_07145, partial [Alphaproteobacteria bacterium]|nr:hypothetical protein [Alphaproteobacteria bacterium]
MIRSLTFAFLGAFALAGPVMADTARESDLESLWTLLAATPAYEARLTVEEEDITWTGAVHWSAKAERRSLVRDGVERIIIVDRADDRLISILPAAQYAVDYSLQSLQAKGLLVPNPRDFALSREWADDAGEEEIGGVQTRKFQSHANFKGRNVDAQLWVDGNGIVRRVLIYEDGTFLEPLREMRLEDVEMKA